MEEKAYEFGVIPMGKPRMTQRDKWMRRPTIVRWYEYKDKLQLLGNVQEFKLPQVLNVTFYIPVSNSWSEKKKQLMIGKPHLLKPDIDNLLKGIMDTFSDKDEYVYEVHARKLWSLEGKIVVTLPTS